MLARRLLVAAVAIAASLTAAPAVATAQDDCRKGYRCSTVTVPLDRSGATPGTIDLPVVAERGRQPLLILLTGGPGQGSVQIGEWLLELYEEIAPGWRIATFDQRGTGANALRCPAMQQAALTDLTVPPPGAVEQCARTLGDARAFYTTTATVEDLDAVRAHLGARRTAISGVSYGTYVAERYARAHPGRVSRLVLDSVVPQQNVDPLFAASMRRMATVLRQYCGRRGCEAVTDDPVGDLRRLVARTNRTPIPVRVTLGGRALRTQIDGPALFDLSISLASFLQANLKTLVLGVDQALAGRPAVLKRLYAEVRKQQLGPAPGLSWGLHTATLCEDLRYPFADAAARAAQRPATAFGVFGPVTAAGNGLVETCRRWPPVAVEPAPEPGPLPRVPILMLSGSWDMSTPVADAREEARRSPTAQLVVIPEAGHSTITGTQCAPVVVRRFMAGKRPGNACADHRGPRPGDTQG